MGLFSGSDETYVSTTANRVVADNKFISSVKSGTIKSIFAHGETSDYILEDMVNGIGFTARPFFKYGRDKYTYGLPHGSGVSQTGGGNLVKAVLLDIYGQEMTVIRNSVAQYNFWFEAFNLIDLRYNLNPITLKLINPSLEKGVDVSLAVVYLIMNQTTYDSLPQDSLVNHSVLVNPERFTVQIDNGAANNSIKIWLYYSWPSGSHLEGGGDNGNPVTVIDYSSEMVIMDQDIGFPGLNSADQYFQTLYRNQGNTNYGWWRYKVGSGTWPTLDNVFNPAFNQAGSYFPWVYFRYNKVKGNEDKNDPGYKTAKKMLKKIHMDYDAICDSIHQSPDIENVEQAMLMWSVEADSTNPLEQRYLYEYFDSTFIDSGGQVWDVNHEDLNPDTVGPLITNSALIIQDARFKLSLSNMGIYKRAYVGTIGPVGTYSSGEMALSFKYSVTQETEGGAYTFDQFYPVPSHYYRKQVQPGYYEEIFVFGLSVRYFIYGDYGVTADGDTPEDRSDVLLIPLDLNVTKHFSLRKREELYSRSLHFIFNARVTVHLSWYQSSFFQFFILVVALAIAVYDGGATLEAFVAATATLTAEQILLAVVMTGLEYLVTAVAFKLFIKVAGVKVAFLVAIIAIAYGISAKFGDELGANLSQQMPFAKDLLQVGQGLSKAITETLKSDMTKIQEEMSDLSGQAKALDAQLAVANKLLDDDNKFAPFIIFGEPPEDYFNRTIHAGNIGMIGIDAVGNYVERSLSLPTLSDTIGEQK
jgi:hypothetical protein